MAKCYTPGVLYEDDICNDCIGRCITENIDPATGLQFPDGHRRPDCDFCRRACYAMNAKSCAYTTGYATGIPCAGKKKRKLSAINLESTRTMFITLPQRFAGCQMNNRE